MTPVKIVCDVAHADGDGRCSMYIHPLHDTHVSGPANRSWRSARECVARWDKYSLSCVRGEHHANHGFVGPHLDPVWGPWTPGEGFPILHRHEVAEPAPSAVRPYTWEFGMTPSLVAYVPGLGDPKNLLTGEGLAGLERDLVRAMLTNALTRLDESGPTT